MPDGCGNIGTLSDLENFIQRRKYLIGFRALVRKVNPAIAPRDFRQFDQFVSRSKPARHILKRRADPKRALLHRPCEQLTHLFEFTRSYRTIVLSDHIRAQSSRADECAQIDGRPGPLEMPK